MLCSSNISVSRNAVLTWAAITRIGRGVELAVRNSKTIQFPERVHTIPLAALFYPVYALDLQVEMCGVQNCSPRTPVFKIPFKSGRFIPVEKVDFLALPPSSCIDAKELLDQRESYGF